MNALKPYFLLDPSVVFLNHGSFGATPKPVFDTYQQWQRQLEQQPVAFLGRQLGERLATVRQVLADYLTVAADDLALIPNTTYGINIIARSLDLGQKDEVLTTNHEYGACDKTWQFMSQKQEFAIIRQPIELPLTTDEAIVDQLWHGVTPKTKVIFLSHVTSATAVIFPVATICKRAREQGILTIIDGAHAPGQLDLNLSEIGADFYCGNLHKWLSAPKGSAFIYARPAVQQRVEPLVVSWGWGEPKGMSYGSDFLDYLQWTGTADPAAYLSVPAAISFQQQHQWYEVREQCHALLRHALAQLSEVTGLDSPYGSDHFYAQMGITQLPESVELVKFKEQLYERYGVEIPCMVWNGRHLMRLSIQGYNTPGDVAMLLEATQTLLNEATAS